MQYYLAIDIGASSGRHILGCVKNGCIELQEVYRFENTLTTRDGHLCWDTKALFAHILAGMKACKELGKIPATMGIDTWGVDFVLLDKEDKLVGDTVAYRDARTNGMVEQVEKRIAFKDHYARTGIQKMALNTVYQMMALKLQEPAQLEQAECFLMIPDYFHYLLTGVKKNEYTNATTTAMVNAEDKMWDKKVIEALELPENLFGPLAMPGEEVGALQAEVQQEVGFTCKVILPPTHDTASAFLAVPAKDEQGVYLSSGTWSLMGMESLVPIIDQKVEEANFTNEGGYNYRYRFLKNIMGLWMIQSIRRENDKKYSFAQLEEMARQAGNFASRVDVNSDVFLAPEHMGQAVAEFCESSGQVVPANLGETMQCIYLSLAEYYAKTVKNLTLLTGRTFNRIHIVGGGGKDTYLNELTAKASGLPVYAGPTEATVTGNLMAQMIAAGEFGGLEEARQAVERSFPLQKTEA